MCFRVDSDAGRNEKRIVYKVVTLGPYGGMTSPWHYKRYFIGKHAVPQEKGKAFHATELLLRGIGMQHTHALHGIYVYETIELARRECGSDEVILRCRVKPTDCLVRGREEHRRVDRNRPSGVTNPLANMGRFATYKSILPLEIMK